MDIAGAAIVDTDVANKIEVMVQGGEDSFPESQRDGELVDETALLVLYYYV